MHIIIHESDEVNRQNKEVDLEHLLLCNTVSKV